MERYNRDKLMKKILIYISVVLFILGSFITASIFNKNYINDSVVYIECIDEETIRSGSGFVYKVEDNKGYVITSYHVIEGYSNIYVYNNDKKKIKASILDYDEYTDIAILIVENKLDLKEVVIGDSNKIKIEDKVIAIGSLDLGRLNSKSKGKIINTEKQITVDTTHGSSNLNLIELIIDVTYGNSGGPLLNKDNEVIGMMLVKEENKNIAYAMPSNFVIDIVRKLENNELERPNLGAVMCNSTNIELLNEYGINVEIDGVVILELNELGVLYKNCLEKGDVITAFNGITISNVNELREELYKNEKGNNAEITYYRYGAYYEINVEL